MVYFTNPSGVSRGGVTRLISLREQDTGGDLAIAPLWEFMASTMQPGEGMSGVRR